MMQHLQNHNNRLMFIQGRVELERMDRMDAAIFWCKQAHYASASVALN